MHNYLISRVLAVAAIFCSFEAAAAALIQGTHYEDRVTFFSCSTPTTICVATFSPVPADKMLRIRRVSCYVDTGLPIRLARLGVATTANGLSTRTFYFSISPNTTGNGRFYYLINQEVDFLIGEGRFPKVVVSSDGGNTTYSMECIITGELLTP